MKTEMLGLDIPVLRTKPRNRAAYWPRMARSDQSSVTIRGALSQRPVAAGIRGQENGNPSRTCEADNRRGIRVSPRPGGDVSNSSEFAVMGSGEYAPAEADPATAARARQIPPRTNGARASDAAADTRLPRSDVRRDDPRPVVLLLLQDQHPGFLRDEDFLLAAIRNPAGHHSLDAASPHTSGISADARHRNPEVGMVRESQEEYANTRWNSVGLRTFVYGLFVLAYAIVFTQLYADRAANRIKEGKGRRVAVSRTDGISSDEQPILLGATGKFVFLYFPDRKATEIVPVENTVALTVDSRRRRERRRDSLAAMGQDSITP